MDHMRTLASNPNDRTKKGFIVFELYNQKSVLYYNKIR